ncbi:MAG: deoxynucleoside kinase [Thermodesulfovibrionales bacterium]|nr:deoxynucleoside kinase [Thermodesulfovibrionales bacterium]
MKPKNAIFIVFEGADGVGKSTQVRLLKAFLKRNRIKHKFIHFPQYKKKPYGEIISRYLRGEFGKADEVSPYLASLLYAGDRMVCTQTLRGWLNSGFTVVADRYILSNIAFQRAKIKADEEKEQFTKWIQDLEYRYNEIIKPDITLFLDASDDLIFSRLSEQRGQRTYLKDKTDIHESDTDYQKRVIHEYRILSRSMKDVVCVQCCDKNGIMMTPKEIHEVIVHHIKKRFGNVFKT